MAWPCQLTIGSCLSIRIVGYKAVSLLRGALAEYTQPVYYRAKPLPFLFLSLDLLS